MSDRNVPRGWTLAPIGALCSLQNGRAFKPTDWTPSGLPIVRIQNLNNKKASFNRFDGAVEARFLIEPGDLLFAWSGTPGTSFGAHEWDGPTAVLNQHIFNVHFDRSQLDKRFFKHAINDRLDALIGKAHGGAGLAHVTKGKFEETEVALPPLNEQRRIVEKLDAVFEKSRAAKARLERLPALLDQLKRSILAAAFRGDLTKDWRAANPDVEPASGLLERIRAERRRKWEEGLRAKGKDPKKATYEEPAVVDASELPELPEGWVWTSMRELAATTKYALAIGPFGSSLKVDDYREQGVPLVFVRNVRAKNYVGLKPTFISLEKSAELGAHRVMGGDLLVTKMGDPPGDADVYPIGLPPAVVTADVIKVTVDSALSTAKFIATALYSEHVRRQVLEAAQGVAQQKMSLERFERILVPVPSYAEQEEILGFLSAFNESLDAIRQRLESCTVRTSILEQTALAKAFRGELVPQDPNDEPADVLLERLRSSTNAAPAAKRTRSPRTVDAPPTTPAATVGDPVDGIVSIFREQRRQSASAIVAATGLDAAKVKTVLKSLERLGKVSVEGKARSTTYVWQGDA